MICHPASQPDEDELTAATNYHEPTSWAMRSSAERCRIVGKVRHEIAHCADLLVSEARNDQRRDEIETVASELIPLCDALGWIARRGPRVLRKRSVGLSRRPIWMWGVRSIVQRVPLGRVLILGTWNYPLFLSGVQAAQALAAGNSVLLKPAPGSERVTSAMVDAFHRAGIPKDALQLLDSSTDSAISAIDAGVDLIVLTGSAATGKRVLRQAADHLTPAIMELSGVDAALILDDADQERVVSAIRFGLLFNSGATCIGPRRAIYLHATTAANEPDGSIGHTIPTNPRKLAQPPWIDRLVETLRAADPVIVHPAARNTVADVIESAIELGAVDRIGKFNADEVRQTGSMSPVVMANVPEGHAVLQSDMFAPVLSLMPVDSVDDAITVINTCPYRLAASVFGPTAIARHVASQLSVGSVVVNDLVAPTADPRLPFGGRGDSGFGVTRGPEGLLAMTTPRVISTRRGRIAPHLSARNDSDAELLTGVLQLNHSRGFRDRFEALRRLTTAARRRS
ncbi:aldehyde dehydrogenase (NAD+) [Rhodopirellula rubra]|uniref:Aldehyde dehydrogenase (NAD+) n=2 Tax=Aporhodopirellula rubra TaxID=980271 RepID=A0A7W5E3C9_9BACT|nr:aldehyde dehydrogenase (NAD+) [Aporhodopirellula rubra]